MQPSIVDLCNRDISFVIGKMDVLYNGVCNRSSSFADVVFIIELDKLEAMSDPQRLFVYVLIVFYTVCLRGLHSEVECGSVGAQPVDQRLKVCGLIVGKSQNTFNPFFGVAAEAGTEVGREVREEILGKDVWLGSSLT